MRKIAAAAVFAVCNVSDLIKSAIALLLIIAVFIAWNKMDSGFFCT
jgi:hypothetical protein